MHKYTDKEVKVRCAEFPKPLADAVIKLRKAYDNLNMFDIRGAKEELESELAKLANGDLFAGGIHYSMTVRSLRMLREHMKSRQGIQRLADQFNERQDHANPETQAA